jgi:CRISPR-associated endonuclease Cas2
MNVYVFIQITYDIHDNVLRYDISETLRYFCLHRIQYSVFQGNITLKEKEGLLNALKDFSLSEGDSIQILELCSRCFHKCIVLGNSNNPGGYRIF